MNRNRNDQPFELTSDMTEIALLAFVSPEAIDRCLAELFGETPANQSTPHVPGTSGARVSAIG